MFPIGSSRRVWLNQSTHSRVANSTASRLRHGPRRWITSALNKPLIVSARALSYESPTLPTEGSMPASASRSVYLMETYWAPLTPFCLSSGDACSVDVSLALPDEGEDFSGQVALEDADGVELGMTFGDAAGDELLGPLIGP